MPDPFADDMRPQEYWRAVSSINAFRCLIAVGLAGTRLSPILQPLVNVSQPETFKVLSLAYLVPASLAVFCTIRRQPDAQLQVAAWTLFDICFISGLAFAGPGAAGGLPALLIVFIACAGALLATPMAALLTVLAIFGIMLQEASRQFVFGAAASDLFQAGLLGVLLLIVTVLTQWLMQRVTTSRSLLAAHSGMVRNLTELNRRIIDQIDIGAIAVDYAHRIHMTNTSAIHLLDLNEPPPADTPLDRVSPALARALTNWLRAPGNSDVTMELAGRTILPSFSMLPVYTDSAASATVPILIFIEDAQRQSEQAQHLKLAALGRLSAGIAHEIRNPLSAIRHSSQLLAESDTLSTADHRLLAIIQRHIKRIDTTITDVMGLARRTEGPPPVLQLQALLQDVMQEYHLTSEDPAEISLESINAEQTVMFEPHHLERVLFNLFRNAERHARIPGTALHINLSGHYTRDNVYCLDVVDNGSGLDTATNDRVLEPFYTTTKEGIGLGLHIVRELCESNGARLLSLPRRRGACFRIMFAAPRS